MAVCGLSSTLSLAIRSLPLCSEAISSSVGAIILQGPHHSAQKSTSTGVSAPPTVSSKVLSERYVMSAPTGVLSARVGRVYLRRETTPCRRPFRIGHVCAAAWRRASRSEEHTSELQSPYDLVCRL